MTAGTSKKSTITALKKTADHDHNLLLALSRAARSIQQARDAAEIFSAVGREIKSLGGEAAILMLNGDGESLSVVYTSHTSKIIRQAEKLTGLMAQGYRFPISPKGIYAKILAGEKAVFTTSIVKATTEALPKAARPLAGALLQVLKLRQGILAPLRAGDENLGLLALTGMSLEKDDVPAMESLAGQIAAGLQNIQLIQKLKTELTARKQAEKQLRVSTSTCEEIFNSITEAVYILDKNCVFLKVNSGAEKMYGYPPDYFVGRTPEFVSAPGRNDLAKVWEYLSQAYGGQTVEFEFWGLRKDGSVFPKDIRLTPGAYLGERVVIAVGRDITEHKRVEEVLQASEENFKSLYQIMRMMTDNMPDLVWAKDMEGRYIFANKAIAEKLLIAKDTLEPIGRTDLYFAERQRGEHPEDPDWHTFGELCVNSDAVVHASQRAERFEEFGNIKGCLLFLDVHKSPFWDNQGRMIGTVGVGRDITHEKKLKDEHRQAREALARSEQAYKALFENVPVGLYRTSIDGRILDFNPAMINLFGYPDREMLLAQKTENLYADPSDQARFKEKISGSGFLSAFESEFRRFDQSTFWAEEHARVICDKDGSPLYYEGSLININDRKLAEKKLFESERYFRALIENGTDGTLVVNMDGSIRYESPSVARTLGYGQDALTGTNAFDLVNQEDMERIGEAFMEGLSTPGFVHRGEYRLRHSSGEWRYFEIVSRYLLDDPVISGIIINGRDITARKQAEASLVESEKQYRLLAERVADVVWVLDAQTMKFKYVSPSVEKLLGYTPEEMLECSIDQVVLPDSLEYINATFPERVRRFLEGDPAVVTDLATVNQRRKDGSSVVTEILNILALNEKRELEVIGVARDITQRRQAENELRRANESLEAAHRELQKMFEHEQALARTDGLTGLCNRRYFFELATREFQASLRYQRPLTIILFDVDGFKQANDTFGHATGDSILIQIARTAAAQIRNVDVLARYGGDEFIIMLPQTHAREAFHIAERIRGNVAVTPVAGENSPFIVTVSLGVAEINHSPRDESVEDVIRRADKALYEVKQNGSNHTLIFTGD